MTTFNLPGTDPDPERRMRDDALLDGVNFSSKFIYAGTGVPTFDPGGPALFFRSDFAVGASVYAWDGSWVSVT